MEIKVTIENLTHEDLVNLLSTALYHSHVFYGRLLAEYKPFEKRGEGECFEDKMANVLLNGGRIAIADMESEGEVFSNDGVFCHVNEQDDAQYHIDLKAVKNGLKKAFESKDSSARVAALNFLIDDGTFDATDADNLMQMIIFGEVIYG